jgi:hypothetical protein
VGKAKANANTEGATEPTIVEPIVGDTEGVTEPTIVEPIVGDTEGVTEPTIVEPDAGDTEWDDSEVINFFVENPKAKAVLRVGTQLFLDGHTGAAKDISKRLNLPIERVSNPFFSGK